MCYNTQLKKKKKACNVRVSNLLWSINLRVTIQCAVVGRLCSRISNVTRHKFIVKISRVPFLTTCFKRSFNIKAQIMARILSWKISAQNFHHFVLYVLTQHSFLGLFFFFFFSKGSSICWLHVYICENFFFPTDSWFKGESWSSAVVCREVHCSAAGQNHSCTFTRATTHNHTRAHAQTCGHTRAQVHASFSLIDGTSWKHGGYDCEAVWMWPRWNVPLHAAPLQ